MSSLNSIKRGISRGFSLLEIMIVLGLTSLILFMVSALFSQTTKTLKYLKEKSRTVESATLGCERLASELREAVDIVSPIALGQIRFSKISPSAPDLIGNSLDDPPETWLRQYRSGQRAQIEYSVDTDSKLLRTASGQTALVASEVNLFQVEQLPTPGALKIRLSLQEQRRVVVFESVVICPALQAGATP